MTGPKPLAERMRPSELQDLVGQSQAVQLIEGFLRQKKMPHVVFWGPPGSGKTTLSRIIADQLGWVAHSLNATSASVKDMRLLAERARQDQEVFSKRTLVHIDEIHRLSRSQQDVLLPFTEDGTFVLAGATTENPAFALNQALRSRVQLVRLEALDPQQVRTVIEKAAKAEGIPIAEDAIELLARRASGDVRLALGTLESAAVLAPDGVSVDQIHACLSQTPVTGDRAGDNHYDLASAFQKSLRGSDANAAIYYLARFLEGGEDPRFVARRLWITAAEDVGNADPQAVLIAASAYRAVVELGLPEARIPLAQATLYVARAEKSNEAIQAIGRATQVLRERPLDPIPKALRDSHYSAAAALGHGEGYPSNHRNPKTPQKFLPEGLSDTCFVEKGAEKALVNHHLVNQIQNLLSERGNDWYELQPSTIAEQLGADEKAVRAAINHLVTHGALEYQRRFRNSV